MIEAGFVIIAAAVLLWTYLSIPRAALACGDAAPEAYGLRRGFLLAALTWTALTLALAWTGVLARWDWRPPPLMFLFVGILNALSTRDARQAAALSEAWRPWRAYAVMKLWLGLEPPATASMNE